MDWIETTYAAITVASLVVLFVTFLVGEIFDFGGAHFPDWEWSHDILGHGDADSPSMLSGRIMSAGFVGFGAFGLIASTSGLGGFLSLLSAVLGFALVSGGTFFGIVKPLYKQEFNATTSRDTYLGKVATVGLEIVPGKAGTVSLVDGNRTKVTQRAWTNGQKKIAPGTTVYVVEVTPAGVVVSN